MRFTSHNLEELGFNVQEVTICKICGQRAIRDNCSDHYQSRGKTWAPTMTKRKMVFGVAWR